MVHKGRSSYLGKFGTPESRPAVRCLGEAAELEHFHLQSCAELTGRVQSGLLLERSSMKTLPVEYRYRVLQLTEAGDAASEIADGLGPNAARVRSIKALHRSGQPLEPKSKANHRRSCAERDGERIRARVQERPGTTLEDLRRDLGLKTSISNLWNALRDLKLSLKKSRSGPPSRTGPTGPPRGPNGTSRRPASIRDASFSSTNRSARPR